MKRGISQNRKELFGRCVHQEMVKQGLSAKVVADRSELPLDYVTQLLEGQPIWLSHHQMVKLVKALNLCEASSGIQVEKLSYEELESLIYPQPPEQLEMHFDWEDK